MDMGRYGHGMAWKRMGLNQVGAKDTIRWTYMDVIWDPQAQEVARPYP